MLTFFFKLEKSYLAIHFFLLGSNLRQFHGFITDILVQRLFEVSPDHQSNPHDEQHRSYSEQPS